MGRAVSDRISFVLPGTPIAKARPRFTGNGRTYTDAKTRAAEQSILAAYLVAAGGRPPHNGPVYVHIVAMFTPADSWPKWKRERALHGIWPHTAKPDLDNLVKIIDGLNGRAWLDDSQIVCIGASKLYGATPSTTITLTFEPAASK